MAEYYSCTPVSKVENLKELSISCPVFSNPP